ncbi:hypothetical protein [Arsenicicoccus bolidensis]|uniref:hypothetical protein n=1 Tax=Arsenicicoccus bolidensis TaxID=229480 RepID=UPI0012EB8278|nr:hypothetical protein [Arsenicicoccus bolidensis]
MTTEDALTLALLALDACVRPEAADQVPARMKPRQASEAMYRLSEARRTLRRSHPPRCASCGDPLAAVHGPAYCADELEGSLHRIADLATCSDCPGVLSRGAIALARSRGWTYAAAE